MEGKDRKPQKGKNRGRNLI